MTAVESIYIQSIHTATHKMGSNVTAEEVLSNNSQISRDKKHPNSGLFVIFFKWTNFSVR